MRSAAQWATRPLTWAGQSRSLEHFQRECGPLRGGAEAKLAASPHGVEQAFMPAVLCNKLRALASEGFSRVHGNSEGASDPFDCREPGRRAVVVESRLNPVCFNGGDIPSITGIERRSQLFLTDGVRASIRNLITEA